MSVRRTHVGVGIVTLLLLTWTAAAADRAVAARVPAGPVVQTAGLPGSSGDAARRPFSSGLFIVVVGAACVLCRHRFMPRYHDLAGGVRSVGDGVRQPASPEPAADLRPRTKVCLISSVPSTLQIFYRPLVEALNREGCAVSLIASPGPELAGLRDAGLATLHEVPITRSISPLRDLASLVRLVRIFRAERFDVVHTHTPKGGMLGMLAAWIARVPLRVHTLHGLPLETVHGWKRQLLTVTERLTLRLSHQVCVVSASLRRRALELGLGAADKLTILGEGTACGIELHRFTRTRRIIERGRAIRRRLGIPQQATVVGYVGRFVADKGIPEMIEAFTRLAETHGDLYLLMVGADDSRRDPLPAATLRTIQQHPRIRYDGFAEDPVPYYAAMDLCVLPSRREGFGMVVLEAAALGVPSVATRVTGCVDAVVDGETGLLAEAENVAELATAMARLVDDAALRRRLGASGRRRVRAHFASTRLVDEHFRLYRAMTRRHDRPIPGFGATAAAGFGEPRLQPAAQGAAA